MSKNYTVTLSSVLKNKTILITGASSGLGKELAFQLAKQKSKLILVARNLQELNQIKKTLEKENGSTTEITCLKCDVSNKNDCSQIIKKTFKKFGKLDYLIANAGVTMWHKFSKLKDPDDLKTVMEINYMGNVYLSYYLLQSIKKSTHKTKLVFISSLQSFLGIPFHTGYSASKHALDGFIKALYSEEPKLPILNVVMAWVRGTNLRNNAFGSELKNNQINHGNEHKTLLTKRFSISRIINELLVIDVRRCAELIITNLTTEKPKIYLPPIAFLVPIFNFFFPNWVEKKIQKIVSKEKTVGTKA